MVLHSAENIESHCKHMNQRSNSFDFAFENHFVSPLIESTEEASRNYFVIEDRIVNGVVESFFQRTAQSQIRVLLHPLEKARREEVSPNAFREAANVD